METCPLCSLPEPTRLLSPYLTSWYESTTSSPLSYAMTVLYLFLSLSLLLALYLHLTCYFDLLLLSYPEICPSTLSSLLQFLLLADTTMDYD